MTSLLGEKTSLLSSTYFTREVKHKRTFEPVSTLKVETTLTHFRSIFLSYIHTLQTKIEFSMLSFTCIAQFWYNCLTTGCLRRLVYFYRAIRYLRIWYFVISIKIISRRKELERFGNGGRHGFDPELPAPLHQQYQVPPVILWTPL